MKKITLIIILLFSLNCFPSNQFNPNDHRIFNTHFFNQLIIPKVVSSFYSHNNNELVWSNKGIEAGLTIIAGAIKDGLLPNDYHYDSLLKLTQERSNKDNRVQIDWLLTDGIMTYQHHLTNGKILPEKLYKHWNYDKATMPVETLIEQLTKHIKGNTVNQWINASRPRFHWYKALQNELMIYRELASRYTDRPIAFTKIIHPNENSKQIPKITEKMRQLNLIDSSNNSTAYRGELVQAIKTFQQHHGLNPDGVIGKNTLAQINVPYKYRANQIRASLERGRWIADDITKDFLMVNIAGFKLYYYQNYQLAWQTKVIVGKEWTKTPVFMAQLTSIVYNPTWTVPRSIASSLVRKAKANPHFFDQKSFDIKTSSGKKVDPDSIDWKNMNPSRFPYWFVQRPGNHNALGRVKFMLPNAHAIYLHDTPTKSLFAKANRSFSHGCIRVENPLDLSLQILNHDQSFTVADQDRELASGKLSKIGLHNPIDVYLMYWTASPERDGFYFYRDIYNRDKQLINDLNTPLKKLNRNLVNLI